MSDAIRLAVFNAMNDDSTLQDLLPQKFNSRHPIFSYTPVPRSVRPPYIVTSGQVTDVPFDTKTEVGREWTRDIRCYDTQDGDPNGVEVIAERVRTIFHRQHSILSISGFKIIDIAVIGPREIPTDEDELYGRLLTLRVIMTAT